MSEQSRNLALAGLLSLLGALVCGLWNPGLVVVGALLPLVGFAFSRSVFRLLWFLVGAMALLNTSSNISTPKLAYLAGVVACVAVALVRLSRVPLEPWAERFRPAVVASIVWVVWIVGVTLPHAVWKGIGLVDWSRDAFTQLLLPAGVLISIDASMALSHRAAKRITVAVGAVAAVQFAITWTSRRALTDGGVVYLFGSKSLIAVPVAVGLVYALTRPGIRWFWLAYGSGALAAVLLTGSRSGLLFSSVYVGIVGSRRKCRVPMAKAVFTFACGVVMVLALFQGLAPFLTGSAYLQARMSSALMILQSGQFGQDMSGRVRLGFTHDAYATFAESPLMGGGVGSTAVVDTPLVYLAKFGLLGTLVLFGVLWSIARSTTAVRGGAWFEDLTIARGVIACWLFLLPSGAPTEDKGFGLGVALLVILVGTGARALSSDSLEASARPARAPGLRPVKSAPSVTAETVTRGAAVTHPMGLVHRAPQNAVRRQ